MFCLLYNNSSLVFLFHIKCSLFSRMGYYSLNRRDGGMYVVVCMYDGIFLLMNIHTTTLHKEKNH